MLDGGRRFEASTEQFLPGGIGVPHHDQNVLVPGGTSVRRTPKAAEQTEPARVSCTKRNSSLTRWS